MNWWLEWIALPRFELIAYWVIAILAGMWGGAGWAKYHHARKKLLAKEKPLVSKINSSCLTSHPNQEKY